MGKENEGSAQNPFILNLNLGFPIYDEGHQQIPLRVKQRVLTGAQKKAIKHKERQLWVVTRAYGDNYYDIQKGSTLTLQFNFETGTLAPSSSSDYDNENPTRHTRVFNATGRKLQVGTTCLIDYRDDNVYQKPYIRASVSMPFGQKTDLADPLVPGVWDQTWANFARRNAGGVCTADQLRWGDRTQVHNISESYVTQWHGLVYQKDGYVYMVKRVGGSLPGTRTLKVTLLQPSPAGTPADYTVAASVSITLDNTSDINASHAYPDANVFYDKDNDFLTVIFAYTTSTPPQTKSRIWTVVPNHNKTQLLSYASEVDCAPGQALFGSNLAGLKMISMNDNSDVFGYQLNKAKMKWTVAWTKTFESLFEPGSFQTISSGNITSGGLAHYGPIYFDKRWYNLISQYKSNTTEAVLEEISFHQASGETSKIVLWNQTDLVRNSDSITKLQSVLDAVEAEVLTQNQGTNSNFPATGNFDEFVTHEASGTNSTGNPWGNSYRVEWDSYLRRYWLGTLYVPTDFTMEVIVSDPSLVPPDVPVNETVNFYTPATGGPNRSPSLPEIPTTYACQVPPAGLPASNPNNNQIENRPFWAGAGSCRGIMLPDGSRMYAALRFVPVYVPPTHLSGQEWFTQTFDPVQYIGRLHDNPPFPGSPYYVTDRADVRRYNGIRASVRFMAETWIFKVNLEGAVTSRRLSKYYSGGKYPKLNGSSFHNISESVSCPENVYSFTYIEAYGQVAILHDDRENLSDDPSPVISVINETDLSTVYSMASTDLIFEHEQVLDKFTTDQVYLGSTWAKAGQYKYDLHGYDLHGPQIKIWTGPVDGRPLLIFGGEFLQRVQPSTGTPGDTKTTIKGFLLREDGFDGTDIQIAAGIAWSYPNRSNFINQEGGPYLIRSLAIGPDRLIYVNGSTNYLVELPS